MENFTLMNAKSVCLNRPGGAARKGETFEGGNKNNWFRSFLYTDYEKVGYTSWFRGSIPTFGH